jgi:transposase InsO family protein
MIHDLLRPDHPDINHKRIDRLCSEATLAVQSKAKQSKANAKRHGEAAAFRGYPKAVRTDSGPEFTARLFLAWTQQREIEHILVEPGCPTQSARAVPLVPSDRKKLR